VDTGARRGAHHAVVASVEMQEAPADTASSPGATRTPRRRISLARLAAVPVELRIMLALAGLLAVAWAVALAPFQAPDEIEHFGYVQRLAETGSPPSATTGSRAISSEESTAVSYLGFFSLRGVLDAREAWNPQEQREWSRMERRMAPDARSNGAGPNPAARNPPLYYAYEVIPYRLFGWSGLFSRLFVLRLAGGLLFVATVLCAWLLAAELFARSSLRVIGASVVALQPELGATAAGVNPDILLVAVWAAFLVAGVRLLKHGPSRGRVAAFVACVVASTLTHGRGLPLLVPALFVTAVFIWRLPAHRRRLAGIWVAGGLLAAIAVAVALRVAGLYGGTAGAKGGSAGQFVATLWQFYFPRLEFMGPRLGPDYGFRQVFIDTFFGTFGSLEISLPQRAFDVLQWASVGGFILVLALLVVRRRALRPRAPQLAFLALTVVALVGFLHVASYVSLLQDPTDPVITGRYLLPGVVVLGMAVAFVAGSLPRRLGACVGALVLSGGVVLQLASLGATVLRFYA
jgi:Dolichyl-phosphate-mannose-protein mannosyltransferase